MYCWLLRTLTSLRFTHSINSPAQVLFGDGAPRAHTSSQAAVWKEKKKHRLWTQKGKYTRINRRMRKHKVKRERESEREASDTKSTRNNSFYFSSHTWQTMPLPPPPPSTSPVAATAPRAMQSFRSTGGRWSRLSTKITKQKEHSLHWTRPT